MLELCDIVVTIKILQRLFAEECINWRLAGRSALLVHGIKVQPTGVDIVVDQDDFDAATKIVRTFFITGTEEISFNHRPTRVTTFELWPIQGEILEADLKSTQAVIKTWHGLKIPVNHLKNGQKID